MSDLITIAFQADLTRVVTLMYSREAGIGPTGRSACQTPITAYRIIRTRRAHGAAPEDRPHHVAMLPTFWRNSQTAQDETGSLLDQSMVVYGSSLSDSNAHTHDNLPTLVAGGGSMGIRGGRHLRYPDGTPMTNLFLTMLDPVGCSSRPGRRQHGTGRALDRPVSPASSPHRVPPIVCRSCSTG